MLSWFASGAAIAACPQHVSYSIPKIDLSALYSLLFFFLKIIYANKEQFVLLWFHIISMTKDVLYNNIFLG